jgi:hypothetical protein
MPNYTFTISRSGRSKPSVATDCPDDDAARKEAGGMFVDMARDIADDLQSKPKWQIEVTDEAGKPIFRIGVLAETME